MADAANLQKALEGGLDPSQVRVLRAPCMGRCDTAPVLELGHNHIDHATLEAVGQAIAGQDTHPIIPDYEILSEYQKNGGYSALQNKILASGLRELGGAGFLLSGKKWGFVRANEGLRYLAVNGEESEPGTFKDLYYLESMPHLFLDGVLMSAWAVEAEKAFTHMRDEYPAVLKILADEIAALEAACLAIAREGP